MKAFSLLFSLLGLTLAASLAPATQEVWVDGVSLESGWIDYEKKIDKGDGDDNLCWAASASNIIDYWQDRYNVPEGIPTGAKIWETFKTACSTDNGGKDTGGNFILAMQWWIGGDYAGITMENDLQEDEEGYIATWKDNRAIAQHPQNPENNIPVAIAYNPDFGGYYWDIIPDAPNGYASPQCKHFYDFLNLGVDYTSMAQCLISQLNSPISLGITNNLTGNDKLAHAITLWGMQYDEEKNTISKLWITDSDDYQTQLKQINVYYADDTPGTLYLDIYDYDSTMGDARVYIDSAYGINLSESDTWNLVRAIPEPATATLSLLTLAGLVARRRRT